MRTQCAHRANTAACQVLQDGRLVRTASTAQDLALIVTLFRRKDGSFEKKEVPPSALNPQYASALP